MDAQPPRIPYSSLPIRLETLPLRRCDTLASDADDERAHLYVANDKCHRCDTLTLVLRIEPIVGDCDIAGRDIDATTQFCPTCLEQLARDVRGKAGLFAAVAP